MRITKDVKDYNSKNNKVKNYMGGVSYSVSPITKLKLISASSIFAEPMYYRKSKNPDCTYKMNEHLIDNLIILNDSKNLSSTEIMENAINEALNYDFYKTLEWAVELRNKYNMRLNPQVILVLAAMHPKRVNFNKNNPKIFKNIAKKIVLRGDEPSSGLTYYLYKYKKKNNLPNFLKLIWKEKLESLNEYQINKYKNNHVGMINTIRVTHANNNIIDKLMRNKLEIKDTEKTWINYRSDGLKWTEIIDKIFLSHQALLRNLKGIFSEIDSKKVCEELLRNLEDGVIKGKQFPFRYYHAYNVINNELNINNKNLILDCLERCIDISMSNFPILGGRTACLADNSGSCWGTFTSEYGKNTVAHINNLSSVITAINSENGEVIKFGDKFKTYQVSKRNGVLYQSKVISESNCKDVGGNTENGIWLFFKEIISNKIKYDNIFIYSDQQAGHGKLYGLNKYEYMGYNIGMYFDIVKLINKYRSVVNNEVNVYSIQTAGYDNMVIPEYLYRTYILSGWTGKEIIFAKAVNEIYNSNKSSIINI